MYIYWQSDNSESALCPRAVVRDRRVRVVAFGEFSMRFVNAYVLFLNLLTRFFGAMALLVGLFFLLSAYAITANRAMFAVVGILAIAVGVAVFLAKPITAETITTIRRRMGRPE
jgi:exosortase/archaeosortase